MGKWLGCKGHFSALASIWVKLHGGNVHELESGTIGEIPNFSICCIVVKGCEAWEAC